MKKQAVNKMTGTELLSEDSDESYKPSRPPHLCGGDKPHTRSTKKVTSSATACTTTSAITKNETSAKIATIKDAEAPISTEMITYQCIKDGLKRPYNEQLQGTPQELNPEPEQRSTRTYQAYSVTKPNFRGKPFAKSSAMVIGALKTDSSAAPNSSSSQDSLRKKKLRLDRKYAHDPSYEKNRKSKVIKVTVLEGSTNTFNRTKKVNMPKYSPDPKESTMPIPTTGRDASHVETNSTRKHNKQTHPFGSIVATSGRILDPEKYVGTEDPPTFYGVVEDPYAYDFREKWDCETDESLVTFVLAGEYPWKTQSKQNVLTTKIKNANLTTKHLPTTTNLITRETAAIESTKWFKPTTQGWKVALFRHPCNGCGSEFCLYNNNKTAVQKLLQQIAKANYSQNCEKRHAAYSGGAKLAKDEYASGRRFRLGYCFVETVRGLFPDPEYRGFRYSDFHSDDE